MHNAPAVSYPVGRSSMCVGVHLLPTLFGALVCGAWAWQSAAPEAVRLGVLLTWGVLAAWAGWACVRTVQGQLAWDGQLWTWQDRAGTQLGLVRPRLDWQTGLLLEFRPLQGRSIWLWPEQRLAPAVWDSLRRAVFAGSVTPPEARP